MITSTNTTMVTSTIKKRITSTVTTPPQR
ncbi:unnamed protein product, partial [Adineta steineri]